MTTPYNSDTPNWEPLERAVEAAGLPIQVCNEFMWMGEWQKGQHSYKHRDTRLYAHLWTDPQPHEETLIREARGGSPYLAA